MTIKQQDKQPVNNTKSVIKRALPQFNPPYPPTPMLPKYERSRTFSGIISNSDYEKKLYMSDIASKISSDIRFDQACEKNYLTRKRGIEYHEHQIK